MAIKELSYSICPSLNAQEGEKVFFYLKDPTLLVANEGLEVPEFYLVEATISKVVIQNCYTNYYTFEYDDVVLVEGTTLARTHIDKIGVQDCNTQFVREMIARNL